VLSIPVRTWLLILLWHLSEPLSVSCCTEVEEEHFVRRMLEIMMLCIVSFQFCPVQQSIHCIFYMVKYCICWMYILLWITCC